MLIKINSDFDNNQDNEKLGYLINNTLKTASGALGITKENLIYEISILITTSSNIKELNQRYRKKSLVTNVLSFPQKLKVKSESIRKFKKEIVILGDIVLCLEKIKDEAESYSKSFSDHFSHLILHGFLHLLGFDHLKHIDSVEMEKKEIEILSKLNIKNPYILSN